MGQPGPGGGKPWDAVIVSTKIVDGVVEVTITTPSEVRVLTVKNGKVTG